jgi:hypothetical protein
MKIIVSLRDPVDRAYSSYHYALNNGYQHKKISFAESLDKEKQVLHTNNPVEINNKAHCYQGLYHQHLSHWLQFFPKEQLFITTLDQIQEEPEMVYKNLCSFLDISIAALNDTNAKNKASTARSKSLQQFLLNRDHWLRKAIRAIVPGFAKKTAVRLKITEKVSSINRKETQYPPMNEPDRKLAADYFAKDLRLLERDFGVVFGVVV